MHWIKLHKSDTHANALAGASANSLAIARVNARVYALSNVVANAHATLR